MKKIKKGTIKRIHVHKQMVGQDRKNGTKQPVLSIQTSAGVRRAYRVKINGPAEIIYRPEKPLSCGGRAWVETKAEVEYE